MRTISLIALLGIALQAQAPQPKHLLAIGDVRGGFQHDSVSHALATIERLGREYGGFVTYIRTDSQLISKQPITAGERTNINGKNLNYFDAIFYMGTGEGDLTAATKADLLSFIKVDGKGFIGAHTGDDAYFTWPEFGEMIGGYFDNHPWGQFDAPVIVEDPNFPAMKPFPPTFTIHDEIYQHKDFSRQKIHVLARLDASKLDFTKPNIHRTDKDFRWLGRRCTARAASSIRPSATPMRPGTIRAFRNVCRGHPLGHAVDGLGYSVTYANPVK